MEKREELLFLTKTILRDPARLWAGKEALLPAACCPGGSVELAAHPAVQSISP